MWRPSDLPAFFERLRERRICRRQCHHPAQGGGVCPLRQRRSAGPHHRRGQHAGGARRQGAWHQYRLSRLSRQSRCRVRRAGRDGPTTPWSSAPAARRGPCWWRCSGATAARCMCSTARWTMPRRWSPRSTDRSRRMASRPSPSWRRGPASWSTPRSIGMHGTRFDWLDLALLPKTTLVTDIVYVPLMTPLLADAAAHGLRDGRWAGHAAASGRSGL